MAAWLASLPSTTLSAFSRCHSRLIASLDGNSVLIDTRLRSCCSKHLGYRTDGWIVKSVTRICAFFSRNGRKKTSEGIKTRNKRPAQPRQTFSNTLAGFRRADKNMRVTTFQARRALHAAKRREVFGKARE